MALVCKKINLLAEHARRFCPSKTSALTRGSEKLEEGRALRAVPRLHSHRGERASALVKAVIVLAHLAGICGSYARSGARACECTCCWPASWTARQRGFLLQKYGPCSQSRPRRVYPRSQLSHPSFSSRSNNNNHCLFAYITPGPRFELNSLFLSLSLYLSLSLSSCWLVG